MNDPMTPDGLPPLSEEAMRRIEQSVFAEIAAERAPARPAVDRARVRRRRWLTAGSVAAAFVVGVLVTPAVLGLVGGGSATSTAGGPELSGVNIAESGGGAPAVDRPADASAAAGTDVVDAEREVVSTANATLRVDEIQDAVSEITAIAQARGGFVESAEVGRSDLADDGSQPAPVPEESDYGWIGVRVPSDELSETITDLSESGEVLSTSISQQDVTSVAIDLRARVDATRASVERLTELMAQSASVSELIEAEVALTERQAQLESYEQQLASLDDQVAMSTLHVDLTRTATTAKADPAGFGDGLVAGWNGLVASLNALVVAIGFVLPWLAIVGTAVLVVWGIRRARRRRRARDRRGSEDDAAGE